MTLYLFFLEFILDASAFSSSSNFSSYLRISSVAFSSYSSISILPSSWRRRTIIYWVYLTMERYFEFCLESSSIKLLSPWVIVLISSTFFIKGAPAKISYSSLNSCNLRLRLNLSLVSFCSASFCFSLMALTFTLVLAYRRNLLNYPGFGSISFSLYAFR